MTPLIADLSKHRLTLYDDCRKQPFQGPYAARFLETPPYALTFVASASHQHTTESPTLLLIKDLFSRNDFKAVIVEGVQYCDGIMGQSFIDSAKRVKETGFREGAENIFTAALALAEGIPVYGGEPTDGDILKHVKKHGFTRNDLFNFYRLRQFSQWRGEGKAWEKEFDGLSRYYAEIFEYAPGSYPDFTAFREWYKDKKISINPNTGQPEDFDPNFHPEKVGPYVKGACFSQLLSAQISFCRDRFILNEVIPSLLHAKRNVLIVYGNGHFPTQRAALEGMLGKPTSFIK